MYLSQSEYDVLATQAASPIDKTRHSAGPLGIDVFAGDLTGLVLAEAEFVDEAPCAAYVRPTFALAEVTRDSRFAGGALATTSADQLARTLQEFIATN